MYKTKNHYLDKLNELRFEIHSDRWMFYYGLHSNIPECCAFFFISKWFLYDDEEKRDYKTNKQCGYVPCPKCRNNKKFNKIHMCTDKCYKAMGYGFCDD